MWLNIFAHTPPDEGTVYSAHVCSTKEERDYGGMRSRPAEPWPNLQKALRQAGLEDEVISQAKNWLDKDSVRPVQIEVTQDQVENLGIPLQKPN